MACKSKTCKTLLLILLLWAWPSLAPAVTPPLPERPAHYVVDLAGVMDAGAQARLNASLKDLEAKTTAQVVVLTINSLEGEPIEDFSHRTAVKWGIGQKGKDNGVLLTVAVKDRKYRLEVGYGLESVLPDSQVGSIGRQYLMPAFRKGDFAGGINAAVAEISKTIAGPKEAGQVRESKPPYHWEKVPKKEGGWLLWPILLPIFILLLIIHIFWWIFRRFRRGSTGGFFWFGGGSGGGWSSGGGDSGGFSGGGGDFGGGGASGDW
jgi:uncharacterized protein